jgi:FixJ family two-component response regulator
MSEICMTVTTVRATEVLGESAERCALVIVYDPCVPRCKRVLMMFNNLGITAFSVRAAEPILTQAGMLQEVPCCLVLSLDLPDFEAFWIMRQLQTTGYTIPIVVTGTAGDSAAYRLATEAGANEVLIGFDEGRLIATVGLLLGARWRRK